MVMLKRRAGCVCIFSMICLSTILLPISAATEIKATNTDDAPVLNRQVTKELVSTKDIKTDEEEMGYDDLLLVSTIDGAIYVLHRSNGHVIWELPASEFPVLKLPQQMIRPLFVANPRNGGLYRLGVNQNGELEKMELGIPEMVSCISHTTRSELGFSVFFGGNYKTY